jgi:hypothetical protein
LPQGTVTPSLQVMCSDSSGVFLPTPFTLIFFSSKTCASCLYQNKWLDHSEPC